MRIAAVVLTLVVLLPGRSLAQMTDVPPCHWAFDSVQRAAGIFVGYPTTPREEAANAVVQLYEGLRCRSAEWVARFTFNRPPGWDRTIARARVVSVTVGDLALRLAPDSGTASYTVHLVFEGGRTHAEATRASLRLVEGRWLVDYATLPPALFR